MSENIQTAMAPVDEKTIKAGKQPKQKKEKRAKSYSIESRNRRCGYAFISPWIIGVIFFFIIPLFQAVMYSFSKISLTGAGLELTPVGWANYLKVFTEDAAFLRTLAESAGEMLYQVPIIIFFSLFVGIILKSKFKGRTVARALFFLPVIIASGVIITLLKTNVLMSPGASSGGGMTVEQVSLFSTAGLEKLLYQVGFNEKIASSLLSVISGIFDLTWKSGVQILLLMSALNSIPSSQYEVADMEGATEWEKFWKITMPLVSPTILVTIVYTIIDTFTDYSNRVMSIISGYISKGDFEYSTTLSMLYLLAVMILIGLVFLVVNRLVFYEVD